MSSLDEFENSFELWAELDRRLASELIEATDKPSQPEILAQAGKARLGLQLFETSPLGLLLIELDTDTIREANPASCQLYGYSKSELVGHSYYNLLQPQSHPLYRKQKKAVLEGKEQEVAERGVTWGKDGQVCFVKFSATPFNYLDKPHALLTVYFSPGQAAHASLNLNLEKNNTRPASGIGSIIAALAKEVKELAPLFNLILFQLKLKLPYTSIGVFGLTEEEDYSVLHYEVSDSNQTKIDQQYFHLALLQTELAEQAFNQQQPVLVSDLGEASPLLEELGEYDALSAQTPDANQDYSITGSWLALPIILKNDLVAVISLINNHPQTFSNTQSKYAQKIISQAIATSNRINERAGGRAVQEERLRMGRELHDSINQVLYGIQLQANIARQYLKQGSYSELDHYLEQIGKQAENGLVEMRALLFELRPEILAEQGLVIALQKHIAAFQVLYNIEIQAELLREDELLVSVEIKETLYRIALEALNNAVKHSKANRLTVNLTTKDKGLMLEVRDNGQGFDLEQSFPGHLGLRVMQERATSIGAELRLESKSGQGTTITVWL